MLVLDLRYPYPQHLRRHRSLTSMKRFLRIESEVSDPLSALAEDTCILGLVHNMARWLC